MLDNKSYTSKPKDPWNINNRIYKHPVDLTPEQLANEIIKGKSYVSAYLNTPVNGELKRSNDCWTSQQIIALDFDDGMRLEEALKIFKNQAMFIYTTFSHTKSHHKFRVVFALSEEVYDYELIQFIMKDFENKYKIDAHCTDGCRIFYGGNKLYVLDYNNRIDVSIYYDDYRKTYIDKGEMECRNNNNHNQYITIVPTFEEVNKYTTIVDKVDNEYIARIKNKDIEWLREKLRISNEETNYYTLQEVKDYLFSKDLAEFLGYSGKKKFNCCFHYDNDPSAGVFYDDIQNKYIYKCFSSNCTFKTGLIIKSVETLLDCDYIDALDFLKDVYNIQLKETDWQKKQKDKIDHAKQYISSDEFQIEYPELHKRIKNYIGDLDHLLDIARLNMPPEHYTNDEIENLFFVSIRHFANRIGRNSIGQVTNEIALFVYLGLVGKLRKDEIPKELLSRAEEELKKNKEKFKTDDVNMISFFHAPNYNTKNLNYSESKAIEFKEKNFTMRGMSREMILRGLGEDEANRVYPQFLGKTVGTRRGQNTTNLIERVTMRLLENNDWVTEEYVINTVAKNYRSGKEYTKTQIKKIMGEMIDKYGLIRVRLNKDVRAKFGISSDKVKGSPNVFYKGE